MEYRILACIFVIFGLMSAAGIDQVTDVKCDGKEKYIQWSTDSDADNMVFFLNGKSFASLHVPSGLFTSGNISFGKGRMKLVDKNMILIKDFPEEDEEVYSIKRTYTFIKSREHSVEPILVEKPGELHLSTAPDYRCSTSNSKLGSPAAMLQVKVNGELKRNSASNPIWNNITTVQCCLTGLVVPCLDEADGQSEWCTPEYKVPKKSESGESGCSDACCFILIAIVIFLVAGGICLAFKKRLLTWFGIKQETEQVTFDGKDRYILLPTDDADVQNIVLFYKEESIATLNVPRGFLGLGTSVRFGKEKIMRVGKNMIMIKNFTKEDEGEYGIVITYKSNKPQQRFRVCPTPFERFRNQTDSSGNQNAIKKLSSYIPEISQDIQTRPYLRESSVRPVDEENAICSINNKVETSLSSVDEESLSLLNKKQEMTEAGGKGGSSSNKRF